MATLCLVSLRNVAEGSASWRAGLVLALWCYRPRARLDNLSSAGASLFPSASGLDCAQLRPLWPRLLDGAFASPWQLAPRAARAALTFSFLN